MAAKIDETDEMKLKMLAALDKPDSDDVLYPPELNAHLIEQLKVWSLFSISCSVHWSLGYLLAPCYELL